MFSVLAERLGPKLIEKFWAHEKKELTAGYTEGGGMTSEIYQNF